MFGGCHDKYTCLSDLYKIELEEFIKSDDPSHLKWQQIKLTKEVTARWGQTTHFYNGQIYIFGGRAEEDLNELVAIDIKSGNVRDIKTGKNPQARRRHAGGFIGSCLVVFGGFDGNYKDDFFYINLYKSKNQTFIE